MDIAGIAEKLHPLERRVLPVLLPVCTFEEAASAVELSKVEVMRALQWLTNKGIVSLEESTGEQVSLGPNGTRYLRKGLPERRLLDAMDRELTIDDFRQLDIADDEINITIGVLKSRAAISISKEGGKLRLKLTDHGQRLRQGEMIEEKFLKGRFPFDPGDLSDEEKFAYRELLKRKGILKNERVKTITVRLTELGKRLKESDLQTDYIERLTPTILKKGLWKNRKFRRYDVEINVPRIHGGKRHFVDQAILHIKRIWTDLGFREMKGNLVQTAFWNMDALFVPQDHPARDMQDTFYIKDPKHGKLPPVHKKVKAAHENGAKTGSKGWRYKWSPEVARENLLRTHTTVLSARTIAGLKESDLPAKFFSVKKVFRNETLNWTHLFELTQVEGIVVDPNANFTHLIGYLKDFFAKLGFPDARVRPGHFPYTEPSAEVDVWHPEKKVWMELGGSGIFRPEVVEPLLGKPVPVLAWGLGLERSIMEYYTIKDIRDLYKNDLKQLREMKVWMK